MDPPASTASADAPRSRLARAWASRPGRALRLAVVMLPFAWLVRRVDPAVIAQGVRRVGWPVLAAGLALQLAISLTLSVRWRLMLRTYGASPERLPTVAYLFRSNLAANYAALLPAPVADEGMRVLRTIGVFPEGRSAVYMTLLAERVVGLTGLLLLAFAASLVAPAGVAPVASSALDVGVAVAAALALAAFATPAVLARHAEWRGLVARLPVVGPTLSTLPAPRRARDLAAPLVISAAMHFASAFIIWLMMSRLDPRASLGVCARVQPLVLLLMAVPVTPAGLGQRELVFATLYGVAGVSAAAAVTTSLLSFSLALAQAGVGGLVLLGEMLAARLAARADR